MNPIKQILVAIVACMPLAAGAQAWPAKTIHLIYPYQAGGLGDPLFRMLAPTMEQKLGQRILFETKPGAGGNIGTDHVVKAAPDGYTLLMAATNNFVINQFVYGNLGFDPLKALAPISVVADVPSVFYVNPGVPANTLREFIEHVRKNPGKINYASPGAGTTPHLNVVLLAQLANINLVHIPYKGLPASMLATMSNDVQLYLAGLGPGRGNLAAGKLRAIAVGSARRLPGLPNVPTLDESGFKGMIASNWFGLAAPAGTDPAIVAKVAEALQAALAVPEVAQRIATLGLVAGGNSPQAFARQIEQEAKVWEGVIRKAGIKLQ